ncbi:hypothetical protein [Halococcus saccharolyticus]|uniref:Uncharacterized protein n=1 Tax=Halococcus saccharolyticus DSM 5350 TaxID=1227455 RepID=M0MQR8_9EURY|nr:hypothetical protein [Halococcus saccharolyticus]EMA47971.1 hypothetical protein C449_00825 [Halococcus saccharolyticus DSM 5350]
MSDDLVKEVYLLFLWDGNSQGTHDVIGAFTNEDAAKQAAEDVDTFGSVHVDSVPLNQVIDL